MSSASPHGTDDPREIVDELEERARLEASPDAAGSDPARADPAQEAAEEAAEDGQKEGQDLAAGGEEDGVAPRVPGSPEPPD